MAESPRKDPLDVAVGLQDLSRFLKSAGFPEASALVGEAAVAAAIQIRHVRAKTARSGKRAPAPKRQRRRNAKIVSLDAHRVAARSDPQPDPKQRRIPD